MEQQVLEVSKRCVICGGGILDRKTEKAQTCSQSCAGKLAWEKIRIQNGF